MGQDLFSDDPFTFSLMEHASALVHEDLRSLCLRGPGNQLMQPRFLQPSLVAVSLGYWHLLLERGVAPAVVMGHSLGEITALAAAGVLAPEDAVSVVAKRGELMDTVATCCDGGMLAVLFPAREPIENLLKELDDPEHLVCANDNAPDQVVLSGSSAMLNRFAALVAERKLGKCRRIPVSGPWHSPYMRAARDCFAEWVKPIMFSKPTVPLILNATAELQGDPAVIKTSVTNQLANPVYWRSSMERLKTLGINAFYEIGPRRVLAGLVRANGFKRGTTVFSISSRRGIAAATDPLPAPVA